MIQLSPPEFFQCGVEHTLFIGFRPLLVTFPTFRQISFPSLTFITQILKAFIRRKATFFADEEWVHAPFQHRQAAPLQDLLGVAAHIPGILEKIDLLPRLLPKTMAKSVQEAVTELMQAVSKLETWQACFLKSSPASHYWDRTSNNSTAVGYQLLWYPSLSTANLFTYLWSFQLICLTHIHWVREHYLNMAEPIHTMPQDHTLLRETCLDLGVRIYRSMEFVMQEDFMLYGALSVKFPLQIACNTLNEDARGRAILSSLDGSTMVRGGIQTPLM
jgi:hypothetical protein